MLTAIVIAFALLADFFFLPALLMKLDKKKEEQKNEATDTTATVAGTATP